MTILRPQPGDVHTLTLRHGLRVQRMRVALVERSSPVTWWVTPAGPYAGDVTLGSLFPVPARSLRP